MDTEAGLLLQNIMDGPVHLRRRGQAGVTQRIVKHVLRPHHRGTLSAELKQLPDTVPFHTKLMTGFVIHKMHLRQ